MYVIISYYIIISSIMTTKNIKKKEKRNNIYVQYNNTYADRPTRDIYRREKLHTRICARKQTNYT